MTITRTPDGKQAGEPASPDDVEPGMGAEPVADPQDPGSPPVHVASRQDALRPSRGLLLALILAVIAWSMITYAWYRLS